MSVELARRRLDVDLLARELGNWRTSSASGPAYQGLSDGLRMLIVDGRLPGRRAAAQRAGARRRPAGVAHHGHRGVHPDARGRLSQRPPRRAQHDGAARRRPRSRADVAGTGDGQPGRRRPSPHPAAARPAAFAEAAEQVTPYLHDIGIELVGVTPLREAIAERYCARGLPTDPDEIMVTTGALHAIGLILATYTQPGDRVLVEQPTYHGALSAMATRGIRPVPVAMTDDGWELDAIDAAVRQLSPSLAYLIPDNHNPTGLTMPADGPKTAWRTIIAETRTRTIVDETITDMWLDEPVPAAVRRVDDHAARSGADRRLDVEVVLGRSAHRLDPRRAQHADHHRARCDRRSTWARRSSNSSPPQGFSPSPSEVLPERRDILRGATGASARAARASTCPTGSPIRAGAECRCGCGCPRR